MGVKFDVLFGLRHSHGQPAPGTPDVLGQAFPGDRNPLSVLLTEMLEIDELTSGTWC